MTRVKWIEALCFSAVLLGAAAFGACSGEESLGETSNAGAGGGGGSGAGSGGLDLDGSTGKLKSLEIQPATATIDIVNGSSSPVTFKAIATLPNGATSEVTATWSFDRPDLGTLASGVLTAGGQLGGKGIVTATYEGYTATADGIVKLHISDNPANVPASDQTTLKSATTPDASCVWAYPYDKTVFPRGLLAPPLMWNGGGASDTYYVHLTSPYFELESFTTAPPPAKVVLDDTHWQEFTDSTSGAADLFVSRFDGSSATVVTLQNWTVAPQSMRGTIYYWANNLGRVMRIKPGSATPDDFANQAPLNDGSQYVQSSCLMTCHTVSADGSTIVSGGGTYGGSYDLKNGQPIHYTGGTWGAGDTTTAWQSVQWGLSALSPNGKYLLTNSMNVGLSLSTNGPGSFEGLYETATGTKAANSGLDGKLSAMPAWSPEGSLIAYVDAGDPASGWFQHWNQPPPGDLRAVDFDPAQSPMASNDRLLVATGSDPNNRILWPTISPDGKWVLYARGVSADTRDGASDLYIASTETPNSEVRLAALDGDGYPFAAAARDLGWNFEPTFAPVASGGFFWVVLTSRRTYGNELVGPKDQVKQLWVAAIDQTPTVGQDPSHPPFRLPGQAADSINMRGFWALDPCKQDGQSCGSGTECCEGYCDPSPDGGPAVCSKKTGCSQNGDHCDTTDDCCSAASGSTCINHVCSEPPPS
jgi:WD40-like Beta Propeller Repeat